MEFRLPPPIPPKRKNPPKISSAEAVNDNEVANGLTQSLDQQPPLSPFLRDFDAGLRRSESITSASKPPCHEQSQSPLTTPHPDLPIAGATPLPTVPANSRHRDQKRTSNSVAGVVIGGLAAVILALLILGALSSRNPLSVPSSAAINESENASPATQEARSSNSQTVSSVDHTSTPTADSPAMANISQPSISDLRVRATPTPAQRPLTYRVVGVIGGDYLNVREGPGSTYRIVARLPAWVNQGIILGPHRTTNGSTTWQEVIVGAYRGWVNADYLAPATQ